jgi:RimJ/RimL family protein N-acetyltransferase
MAHHHWPLFDLRITTPRLDLRYPDDDLLMALADLAAQGIHDADAMPFSIPWTRSADLERQSLQHYWLRRATLTPDDWSIPLVVFEGGELVGVQELLAQKFPVVRTVQSGSWLGRRFQGSGIGTEMRAAVLHLAFAGLDAQRAETGAWHDNAASQAVTRKLGYEPNGSGVLDREGTATRMLRFALTRERWEQTRRDDIVLHEVEPVAALLGLRCRSVD